jgi:hypothetical protein
MGAEARQDSTWVYWKARAMLATKPSEAERAEARQLLEGIAGRAVSMNSWHWKSWASASPCRPRPRR